MRLIQQLPKRRRHFKSISVWNHNNNRKNCTPSAYALVSISYAAAGWNAKQYRMCILPLRTGPSCAKIVHLLFMPSFRFHFQLLSECQAFWRQESPSWLLSALGLRTWIVIPHNHFMNAQLEVEWVGQVRDEGAAGREKLRKLPWKQLVHRALWLW